MNYQLRELLEVIPPSPETDELQNYLTLYCKAFEDEKKRAANLEARLIQSEALLNELEQAEDGKLEATEHGQPSLSGRPLSAGETQDAYQGNAPKIIPVMLQELTSNGYFKLTEKAVDAFGKSRRGIAIKEDEKGLHLFLIEQSEVKGLIEKQNKKGFS